AVGLTWATRTSSHVEIAQRMALIRKSEPSIGILVACGRELFGIRPDRSSTCGSPPDRHHSSDAGLEISPRHTPHSSGFTTSRISARAHRSCYFAALGASLVLPHHHRNRN